VLKSCFFPLTAYCHHWKVGLLYIFSVFLGLLKGINRARERATTGEERQAKKEGKNHVGQLKGEDYEEPRKAQVEYDYENSGKKNLEETFYGCGRPPRPLKGRVYRKIEDPEVRKGRSRRRKSSMKERRAKEKNWSPGISQGAYEHERQLVRDKNAEGHNRWQLAEGGVPPTTKWVISAKTGNPQFFFLENRKTPWENPPPPP